MPGLRGIHAGKEEDVPKLPKPLQEGRINKGETHGDGGNMKINILTKQATERIAREIAQKGDKFLYQEISKFRDKVEKLEEAIMILNKRLLQ